jgi:hypothetical protein
MAVILANSTVYVYDLWLDTTRNEEYVVFVHCKPPKRSQKAEENVV